eukprot:13923951-Ditylum_brightwellii.AAC.1
MLYSNKTVLILSSFGENRPGTKGEAYWSCCSVLILVPTHEEEGEEPVSPRNVSSSESSSSLLAVKKMSKMCT